MSKRKHAKIMKLVLQYNRMPEPRLYDVGATVYYDSGSVRMYFDELIPETVYKVDEDVHLPNGIEYNGKWEYSERVTEYYTERIYKRRYRRKYANG